jgi:phosphopantetheinyl transferase
VPRAQQSAAAEALLAQLRRNSGIAAGPSSKSHSRDCVAAALAEGGRIGVDVEFRAPGRPIEAIASYLMGAPAVGEAASYRVATFREAYFKAFGDWPSRALLREAAAGAPRYRVAGEVNVLHQDVDGDFLLTLVWR